MASDAVDIWSAAYNGNLERVKVLIEKEGVRVNSKDTVGVTPLHKAAWKCHMDIMKYLVSKGADIHAVDSSGATPLLKAAQYKRVPAMKYLIETCKADTHTKNFEGFTVFHYVARDGHLPTVIYYVEQHNVDVNAITVTNGMTPFALAAQKGHLKVVKYLATHGANAHTIDKYGLSPLYHAVCQGHFDIVSFLIEFCGADPHTIDEQGNNILHHAAGNDYMDTVQYLVDLCGVSVHVKNKRGETPLHSAVMASDLAIVKYLVELHGADVNDKDENGDTLLHITSYFEDNIDIVKFLVEEGADVLAINNSGKTALELVTDEEITEYLAPKVLRAQRMSHRLNVLTFTARIEKQPEVFSAAFKRTLCNRDIVRAIVNWL